jgi:hypothetical protein
MKNLVTVLLSPTNTFERLREKGGWLVAFIILILLSVLGQYLLLPTIIDDALNVIKEQIAAGKYPESQFDEDFNRSIITMSTMVGGVIALPLTVFFVGLLLLLVNLIIRGEAKYMQLVKVSLFSSVPSILALFVTVLLIYLTGASSMYEVSLSAAAFVEDKTSFMGTFLQYIGPFSLWGLFLLITGTSVMTRKSKSKAGLWIITGWLIIVLISSFFASFTM